MNIKELRLKNYRSYKDETIYFTDEMYIILGNIIGTEKSNGAGKTSVPLAISANLYGNFPESDIYNDEKISEIGLLFDINGKDYNISRTLERGKTQVITINKKKYGVKAAQEVIVKLLGADYEIFKNTAYFKQGELDSFSKLTPKEAKDVVINILQLGIYNEYEKIVKEKLTILKTDILTLKSKIDNTQELIKTEKEEPLTSKYAEKDLEKYKDLLKDFQLKINLEKLLDNSKKRMLCAINKKYEKFNDGSRELEFSKQNKEKRITKLKNLTTKPLCPTCEHALDKNEIEKIINIIKEDINKLEKQIKPLTVELAKLSNIKKDIDIIDINVPFEYTEAQLVSKITIINEELKQKQKDKNKIKKLEEFVAESVLNLKLQEGLQDRYSNLRIAFGRNGIQAHIIENVLPEVQTTANDILANLDTNIRITIDSQKDLKKGGKAETLDINVITEYGERPYSGYSGGEKTFIDFALRMALSIILARRSNCQIQTLILDEVFGELDSVNKQIISKALRYVANKFNFKKILIISHAEELQDSCDNIIRVKFNGKYSTVTKESKNVLIA